MATPTLGQRIAATRVLSYKSTTINLDGGMCRSLEHNKLPDTGSRRTDILFVVAQRPICEDCYNAEYKAARDFQRDVEAGLRELAIAS